MYEDLTAHNLKNNIKPGSIIGNFENEKAAYVVKSIGNDVVFCDKIGEKNEYTARIANGSLIAIPITYPRLTKLGFRDTSLRGWWQRGNFQVRRYGVAWEFKVGEPQGFVTAIHELQNKYFEYMGNELLLIVTQT